MQFFSAQKQLIKLWFIWTMLLLFFLGYHMLFGIFKSVGKELMIWFAQYLVSVFALIMSSTFFSRELFIAQLTSKIYFYLSLGTSVIYLTFITVVLVILPRTNIHSKEEYLLQLEHTGWILNFLLPILLGVLGYFFYKSKKQ